MNGSIKKIKERLVKVLQSDSPKPTDHLAAEAGVHWNTAEKYLLELAVEGKVKKEKKWGRNLWSVK